MATPPDISARLGKTASAIALAAFGWLAIGTASGQAIHDTQEYAIRAEPVVTRLNASWRLSFRLDGRMLASEQVGQLRIVTTDGDLNEPKSGLPELYVLHQGGRIDVTVGPNFAEAQRVCLTFCKPGETGVGTAVARARPDLCAYRLRRDGPGTAGAVCGDQARWLVTGRRNEAPAPRPWPLMLLSWQTAICRSRVAGASPADRRICARPTRAHFEPFERLRDEACFTRPGGSARAGGPGHGAG